MRQIFEKNFKKILITGGCGFIGSALVKKLLNYNVKILVIDNLETGNIKFLPKSKKIKFIRADISTKGNWIIKVREFSPDLVYHLAAVHFIPYCNSHWDKTILVNLLATNYILEAVGNSIKGFVFASSAAVYSISETPHLESETLSPIDIYGLSKKWAEELLNLWVSQTGVPCKIVRLFNVYGYNETNPHLIPEIIYQKKNGDIILVGNLEPKRDYIFIDDVINALMIITKTINSRNKVFDIYNVGTGVSYSVQEVIETLSNIINEKIKFISVSTKKRKLDRLNLLANIDKLKRLGWKPTYDLYKGLKKYWNDPGNLEWFKINKDKLLK